MVNGRKDSVFTGKIRDTVNHLDSNDRDSKANADEFFDLVDKDGSGVIEKGEFINVYEIMKDHVREEHAKEVVQKNALDKAKRGKRLATSVAVVLLLFLGLSVGANMVTTMAVVEMSKDQYVKNGQVVDKAGKQVASASADSVWSFEALLDSDPHVRSVLRSMETVSLNMGKENEMSFQLLGYNFTGTSTEPKLELYGAASKVCITETFHTGIPIDEPCPLTVAAGRMLTSANHFHEFERRLDPAGCPGPDNCQGDSQCHYGNVCMQICWSPLRTRHKCASWAVRGVETIPREIHAEDS